MVGGVFTAEQVEGFQQKLAVIMMCPAAYINACMVELLILGNVILSCGGESPHVFIVKQVLALVGWEVNDVAISDGVKRLRQEVIPVNILQIIEKRAAPPRKFLAKQFVEISKEKAGWNPHLPQVLDELSVAAAEYSACRRLYIADVRSVSVNIFASILDVPAPVGHGLLSCKHNQLVVRISERFKNFCWTNRRPTVQ
jgi:hypothetical protein